MCLLESLETVVHNVKFREVQERVVVLVKVTVSSPHITTPNNKIENVNKYLQCLFTHYFTNMNTLNRFFTYILGPRSDENSQ